MFTSLNANNSLLKSLIDNCKNDGSWDEGDLWGSAVTLAFDLAEHLYFNRGICVNDFRPGCGVDDAKNEELEAMFSGYEAEALEDMFNDSMHRLLDALKALDLDY